MQFELDSQLLKRPFLFVFGFHEDGYVREAPLGSPNRSGLNIRESDEEIENKYRPAANDGVGLRRRHF